MPIDSARRKSGSETQAHRTAARAVQRVVPDGTHSESLTRLRSQHSQDANGHLRVTYSDVLDRATAVAETLVQRSDRFGTFATADYTETGNATATGGAADVYSARGAGRATG
jgi:hypothetical protein